MKCSTTQCGNCFSDQEGSTPVVKSEDEAAEKLNAVQGDSSATKNNLGAGTVAM